MDILALSHLILNKSPGDECEASRTLVVNVSIFLLVSAFKASILWTRLTVVGKGVSLPFASLIFSGLC